MSELLFFSGTWWHLCNSLMMTLHSSVWRCSSKGPCILASIKQDSEIELPFIGATLTTPGSIPIFPAHLNTCCLLMIYIGSNTLGCRLTNIICRGTIGEIPSVLVWIFWERSNSKVNTFGYHKGSAKTNKVDSQAMYLQCLVCYNHIPRWLSHITMQDITKTLNLLWFQWARVPMSDRTKHCIIFVCSYNTLCFRVHGTMDATFL